MTDIQPNPPQPSVDPGYPHGGAIRPESPWPHLPTEEDLAAEIQRERRGIERDQQRDKGTKI